MTSAAAADLELDGRRTKLHAGFWDWEDIGAQSGAGLTGTGGQKREGEGDGTCVPAS